MANPVRFPSGVSVSNRGSGVNRELVLKHLVIPIGYGDGTTENDTTQNLPSTAIVEDVLVNVTTAEATGGTKTLDVGLLSSETGGDANGFVAAVDVSSTGLKRPEGTFTAGTNETYLSANTRGVLLATALLGSNTATDVGTYAEKPFLTDSVTAKSVSWTPGSTDWAEFAGEIIIMYREVNTL